jgi:hypothetical protein
MSDELQRVINLPRRQWDPESFRQYVDPLSRHLLNDRGRALFDQVNALPTQQRESKFFELGQQHTPIRLSLEQCGALIEFVQCRGLYVGGPVGIGKTLLTLLLSTVALEQFGLERSALFVLGLGNGKQQTHEDHARLTQYWRAPRPPQVYTYTQLSRLNNLHMLCGCELCSRDEQIAKSKQWDRVRPQLLIKDESDATRDADTTTSMRVDRLLVNHPEIVSVSLTGNPIRHSVNDNRRHLIFALRERAPAVADYTTSEEIGEALDNKVSGARRPLGALASLITPEDVLAFTSEEGFDELNAARAAWGRRVAETLGVVLIDKHSTDVPLVLRVLQAPEDPVLDAEYLRFRTGKCPDGTTMQAYCTPDGHPMADPLAITRYETEVSQGFYSAWDPRPPSWWLEPRSVAVNFVREAMAHSKRWGQPLDSELAVYRAYHDHPAISDWLAVRKDFTPNVVYRTISLSVVLFAAEWLRLNSPAVMWVQNEWTGTTLSRLTGLPYYAGGGKSAEGYHINKHPGTRSAILSVHANRRQRNLQRFHRSAMIAPEPSATSNEQRLGRLHRQGATLPVFDDLIVGAGVNVRAIRMMLAEAQSAKYQMRLTQKILTAAWDWSYTNSDVQSGPDPSADNYHRWRQ